MTNLVRLFLAAGLIVSAVAAGERGGGMIGHAVSGQVLLVNDTGLKIARVIIGARVYEDPNGIGTDKILVQVASGKHHLELLFRGGARIDWPDFDFTGVKEIRFELEGSSVIAHPAR